MPRSLYRDTIMVKGPAGAIPLAGAAVAFYQPDGATLVPIDYPLYRDAVSTTPLVVPYITGSLGELEVWADTPHRVRILVNKTGLLQADEIIDLEYPPEYAATTEDISDAILAHEGKPDAHPQYVTEDEGAELWLPLAHEPGGDPHPQYLPATHEPGTDPHPQYLTRTDWGAADPLTQYQLESEKGQGNGYAPLDANGILPSAHLPPLAITDTFVVASETEMLALTAQRGDVAIRTDTNKSYILAADPASLLANWKELSAAAPVLSVNGYTGVVNLTNDDVGAVSLSGDTMTGPLYVPNAFVAGNPLVVNPAPENILTWNGSGLLVDLATTNITVVRREEFSPAASATSVTLAQAPTTVLEVSRNGVAQSAALGHYSVLGTGVTFTDAFAAGEQVLVLYEVGTSVPTDSYTKAEADALFLTQAEADPLYLTPAEGDAAYASVGHTHAYLPLSGGNLTGPLTFGGDVTLARTGAGALRVDTMLAVGGAFATTWPSGTPVVEVGQAMSIRGTAAANNFLLGMNSVLNTGATANLAKTTGAGSQLAFGADGSLHFYTAPSVAAGATQTMTDRMALTQTGTLTVTPDTNAAGVVVGPGPAVSWHSDRTAIQVGRAASIAATKSVGGLWISDNTYLHSSAGPIALWDGPAARIVLPGTGGLNIETAPTPAVGSGGAQVFTTRLQLAQGGTLGLTPAAAQYGIQIASNAGQAPGVSQSASVGGQARAVTLGLRIHGTDKWNGIGAYDNAGGGTLVLMNGADGGVGGNIGFYPAGGQIVPMVDAAFHLGTGALRYHTVYAVAGTINTSSREVKENVRDLTLADALAAVKAVRIVRYDYKAPTEAPTDLDHTHRRNHIGFISEEAPGLLTLDDDVSVSPQSTASVALAAVKALLARVEELEARLPA